MEAGLHMDGPFVLWPVGNQPLLHHWLDYCVDEGYERIVIHCSDRPANLRHALEKASLWPVKWEIVANKGEALLGPGAFNLGNAPWRKVEPPRLTTRWDLLRYWQKLSCSWMEYVFEGEIIPKDMVPLWMHGRLCRIAPDVKLIPPVYIGNRVMIGPGAKIGPNAVIRDNAILAGDNHIENAIVCDDTFVGQHISLREGVLKGGSLLDIGKQVHVKQLDPLFAQALNRQTLVPCWQRLLAVALYAYLRVRYAFVKANVFKFQTLHGLTLMCHETGPILFRRTEWLKSVIAGKMRLFGVLPRTHEQLQGVDEEWAGILKEASDGVLSYADSLGIHEVSEEEQVHAVFEASIDPRVKTKPMLKYLAQLIFKQDD